MIKVLITKQNSKYQTFQITGHSHSDVHGKDLVCAGVSSIVVGMLNAIDELAPNCCVMEMDEGFTKIVVNNYNDKLHLLLESLRIQLNTIEFKYKKYIKIKIQEV